MIEAPELRSARLQCRLAEPRDAQVMHAYRIANCRHLAPWEPLRAAEYYTLDHCLRTVADGRCVARQGSGYPFLVLDADSGQMLATFTLAQVMCGPFQGCLLGYGVAAGQQGRGIMREALEPALDWALGQGKNQLGLHRVMANYLPRNERSGRLLASLGFEREGLARSYLQIAGAWEDHVLTAKIAL